MTSSQLSFLITSAIVIFFIANSVKVASEHQRFAVYRLGKYIGIKGPGFLVKLWTAEDWVKILIGDRLELIAHRIAKIGELSLPVEIDNNVPINTMLRITGFNNDKILTVPDSEQRRLVTCEHCGKETKI